MFYLDNDDAQTTAINCSNESDGIRTKTVESDGHDNGFNDIPDVKKVPEYMNIPNLWNVQLIQPDEKGNEKDETHPESSSSSSEWELV